MILGLCYILHVYFFYITHHIYMLSLSIYMYIHKYNFRIQMTLFFLANVGKHSFSD